MVAIIRIFQTQKAVFRRTGSVNKVINTVSTATLNQSLEAVTCWWRSSLIADVAFDDSSSGFGSIRQERYCARCCC